MTKNRLKYPILITGGEGFIGKNVVNKFLDMKIPVIVIDNNITSYPLKLNNNLYTKINEDICNINIDTIPPISGIIHLASVAAPLVYMDNPLSVINPNTIGTRKMIEIAKRDNVRILYASTSEVYGQLTPELIGKDEVSENENAYISILTNRSSYAAAKRFGEELILYHINSGGDGTNLRLFNVYGSGMDLKNIGYGRVIPNFFHKMSDSKPIDIYGDGEQVRSFTWIEDVVEAILRLFFFKGHLPEAINVGNNNAISINNLADKIADVLGTSYKVNYKEREKDDPLWRRPSINLIKELINWAPEVELDIGLKRIAEDDYYV